MHQLNRQIRKARLRKALRRFLTVWGWCFTAALVVAAIGAVVDRFYPLNISAAGWALAAVITGPVAAMLLTIASWPRRLTAAMEIDRHFTLRERLSSAVALTAEERDTPAGAALVADAEAWAGRVKLRKAFPLWPSRRAWQPVPVAALVLLAAVGFPSKTTETPVAADAEPPVVREQVQRSATLLARKLAEQQAQSQGISAAQKLLADFQKQADALSRSATGRKDAMVKLNDLAREARQARKEYAGAQWLRQQFDRQLDPVAGQAAAESTPSETPLTQAMAAGDFQQAAEEATTLRNQLQQGGLPAEQQKTLAEQTERMSQQLDRLADAHQAAEAQLQQRRQQADAAGQEAEAQRLAEQLDQLRAQKPQVEQARQLARQLSECSSNLKQQQSEGAAEAMGTAAETLARLQQQSQAAESLDRALAAIDATRQRMSCPDCDGSGCPACEDNTQPNGGSGAGDQPGEDSSDSRIVAGRFYDAPLADAGEPDASAESQPMVTVGSAVGPNAAGTLRERIERQIDSVARGETDPISSPQRLPRQHRRHAREYFEQFGKAGQSP